MNQHELMRLIADMRRRIEVIEQQLKDSDALAALPRMTAPEEKPKRGPGRPHKDA